MMKEDDHMHSCYSFDGKMSLENIIQESIRKGIKEIAVTDHIELAAPDIATGFQVNGAKAEFAKLREKYQDQIIIKRGIELGNVNIDLEQGIALAKEFDGDFILGSVHNLKENEDVGYSNYQQINIKDFYHTYLDAIYQVALNADYDVLAHLTYPMKAIYEQTGWKLDIAEYRKQFESIFEIVVRRGKGIEVNTSGLRVSLQEMLPNEEILRLYKACGGSIITVGSDAHEPQYIGEGIREAMDCLQRLGFTEITTFTNRIPMQHCLGEQS